MRSMAGLSMGASGGFPFTTTWTSTTPSLLSTDLGFVTELDRDAEASFSDRAGVAVMQRDDPAGPVGRNARQAQSSLGHDLFHQGGGALQIGDQRLGIPAHLLASLDQTAPGVS